MRIIPWNFSALEDHGLDRDGAYVTNGVVDVAYGANGDAAAVDDANKSERREWQDVSGSEVENGWDESEFCSC